MKAKKINLKKCAAICLLALSPSLLFAQGKLGSLKEKAKEKIGTNKEDKKNENTGSSTTIETTGKETGEELYEKGNVAYEAGNYKEALAYYEKAEENGYSDGEMKIKMRECRDNLDTNKQAEDEKKLNEAMGKMNALDDMKYKCSDIPTDNGSSGTFHDANVGKIVFSKSEIVKGQENASAITNSFTTSDNIYSRVYMNHSIGYECANMGICFGDPYHRTAYRFTVDGGKYDFSKSYFDNGEMTFNSVDEELMNKWTTWQPAMSPASKDGYGTHEMQFFYSMIEFLPAGKHTIKFEIVIDIPDDKKTDYNTYEYTTKFGPEKVVASGEFTLEVKESDKAKIKTKTGAKSKDEMDAENQKAFNSTMESSGVWLINKCSSSVKVYAGGNPVTVNGNGSTRISLKAGDSITDSSGAVLRYFTSDPPSGRRTDVVVCN